MAQPRKLRAGSLVPALALAFTTLACAGLTAQPEEVAPRRPANVVLILADDLGWADISLHGAEFATPNIDGLARDGVELQRFYVSPLCAPTRAGLLSGRSPIHFGAQYTNGLMPAAEVTLAERLRKEDFQTAAIGKWHLGATRSEIHPMLQGFDSFYGMTGGVIDYFTHKYFSMLDWQRDGFPAREIGYSTGLLGREAVRFIEDRDPDRPFFLYLAFNAPHSPAQAPATIVQKYEEAGLCADGGRRCKFAAQVEVLDFEIGRVLDAIDQAGIANETLIIFASDNGADPGWGGSNRPLRGAKGMVYEGGIRVPAIVRWSTRLKPGSVVTQYLREMDLYATIEAALGLAPEAPAECVNMWPVLTGAPEFERPPMFFAVDLARRTKVEGDVQHAVIEHGLKLVRRDFQDENRRDVRHEHLLFDLQVDPEERFDLAPDRPDDVRRLDEALASWVALHPADGARYRPGDVPRKFRATSIGLIEDRHVLQRIAKRRKRRGVIRDVPSP